MSKRKFLARSATEIDVDYFGILWTHLTVDASTVLGTLVPYDRVRRTGANAATVIVFDKDMTIGGAQVPAGAYSLWTIPKADGTVQLVINKQHGQWGTDYDPAQDLVRVPMKASTAPAPQENFAINVAGSGNGGELRISWDAFVWSVPMVAR